MIAGLLVDTVQLLEHAAGATDRFGNATASWSPGPSWPARVEHLDGTEANTDRGATVSRYRVLVDPSADGRIGPSDRLAWNGYELSVDGPPVTHRTPGGPHHVEVRARTAGGDRAP